MTPNSEQEGSRGMMLVISGPSGCGKSTLCKRLLENPLVQFSISATTRQPRKGEVEGREYYFLGSDEFRERIQRGEFIEYAEVHDNMYGTLSAPIEAALAAGHVYLVEIDVQGALQLMGLGIPGEYVFVAPPSSEELKRRLKGRGTDSPEVIKRRLAKAEGECREQDKYDHVVVNDDLETALAEIRRIADLEECQ